MVNFYPLLMVLCIFTVNSLAQGDCERFQAAMRSIPLFREEIEANQQDPQVRESWEKKLREESGIAAISLKRCDEASPVARNSEVQLLRWYQIVKLYVDAQNCRDALDFLGKCRGHKLYETAKLQGGLLKTYLAGMEIHCRSGEGEHGGIAFAEFDGKARYLQQLGADMPADLRPYASWEIEALCARKYTVDQSEQAREYFQSLAADSAVLLQPPFILVPLGDSYSEDALSPQKIIDRRQQSSDAEVQQYLQRLYERLIQPAAKRLTEEYFDARPPEFLIPIYLVGGSLNTSGMRMFVDYSRKIHYRSRGLNVAYYLPYDNSLMVWLASGGGTLIHELVHALIAADFPNAPGWLGEGIASMNEETGSDGEPLDNYRLYYTQAAYHQFQTLIPINMLLAYTQGDFAAGKQALLNSAFARYFCMYLREKNVLSGVYKEIRNSESRGVAEQIALLEKHLKNPLRVIQQDWESWIAVREQAPKWGLFSDEEWLSEMRLLEKAPWVR